MAKDKEVSVKKPAAAPRRLDAFDSWIDELLGRRWLRPPDWPSLGERLDARTPRVDVIDRNGELLVRAELPGVSKDDIDLTVSDNSVTVKGTSRKESEREEGDYHHREIVSSFVSRTVPLPCSVDGDHAKARIKDGVLEVTLPKAAQARRKRIDVEGT